MEQNGHGAENMRLALNHIGVHAVKDFHDMNHVQRMRHWRNIISLATIIISEHGWPDQNHLVSGLLAVFYTTTLSLYITQLLWKDGFTSLNKILFPRRSRLETRLRLSGHIPLNPKI
jgi:hypothetical protein